jgi:hypothetical protein
MRQEDHEFKVNMSYIVSSRPPWATYRNPVSKNKTKQKLALLNLYITKG